MYNWSVDTTELKKDKEKYAIWKLEQLLNYGLGRERISKDLLKKYWNRIFMDKPTRKYPAFLL